MSVGNPQTVQTLNARLGQIAVMIETALQAAVNLQEDVTNLGGASGLQNSVGFASADAAAFATDSSYLNTVAGVYYGTVQQGGSGGTGASQFNFSNALSSARGGQ